MALDEALFNWSAGEGRAVARFYHWDAPAVTAGYFHRSPTTAGDPSAPVPTRRFTGGGLVEHGEDLTFLLAFPAGSAAARANGTSRYRWIHEALADSLSGRGFPVALVPGEATALTGPCFTNPVAWDLLDPVTRIKIGGGAQRRSRGAVIHQGSIRLPELFRDPMAPWIDDFLARLADRRHPLDFSIREKAGLDSLVLEKTRYGSDRWNSRS